MICNVCGKKKLHKLAPYRKSVAVRGGQKGSEIFSGDYFNYFWLYMEIIALIDTTGKLCCYCLLCLSIRLINMSFFFKKRGWPRLMRGRTLLHGTNEIQIQRGRQNSKPLNLQTYQFLVILFSLDVHWRREHMVCNP